MKQGDRLRDALTAAGATLKRAKKHFIYTLPNGNSLTVSATPSDAHSERNSLADLRHALGTASREAVVNPPREKAKKPGRAVDLRLHVPTIVSPLAAALKTSGLQAEAELAKAREMERELRWRVLHLEGELSKRDAQLAALEALLVIRCWRKWQSFFR